MGIEIERKYLVKNETWKQCAGAGKPCRQGYLISDGEKTVRVRIIGEKAYLTIKGPTIGISRSEYEYAIPVADAEALLLQCGRLVEKIRYIIEHAGCRWELDVFKGPNEGLVMAEVELDAEDQPLELPDWIGEEVSGDRRYYNAYLAQHPFIEWN